MVEAHANSVEDRLIDGLKFSLSAGASYIQERKSVTFHPQGSNIYSTNGTKLIKILITGDSWMDPSTFRVMFNLQNMAQGAGSEAKLLRPLGGPHSFFRRMRVLCGGQVVEDIDNYNRVHQMFSILTAEDSSKNVDAEAFGKTWDIRDNRKTAYTANSFSGIKNGQSQTVLFKPLSGLLNQPKYLPIRYCPLTIELELVNSSNDPIISDLDDARPFTAANTSLKWQIDNVQAKVDMCTLDNALDNSYAEHLLSGKAFPINYNTYISQFQSLASTGNNGVVTGQQKVRLNVTRTLSRLKSVFVSLVRGVPDAQLAANLGSKDWNDFYSPMYEAAKVADGAFDSSKEFEAQLQLGSKLYPEYPIRSHSEAFYQLRKTMGVQSSGVHSFDVDAHEYRTCKFIWGTDLERVLESSFSGMNTRSGDVLNVRFDHLEPAANAANYATSMHILLHSDNILEIRDSGCQIYD